MIEIIEYTEEDGLITHPGFYHMPPAIYHKDPVQGISLSSSICKILAGRSPKHAWFKHPRLNKNQPVEEPDKKKEIGQAIHKKVLGRGDDIEILTFDAYRSSAAKEARDNAILAHRIPILEADYVNVEETAKEMADAVEAYFGESIEDLLTELVVVAHKGGVWYRIMLDVAMPDLSRWCDIKSTATSVAPSSAGKFHYTSNNFIQNVFYATVLDIADPAQMGRRECAFIYGEVSEPFVVGPPIEMTEAGYDLGRQSVKRGVERWKACMASNRWPGYPWDTVRAEPPVFLLSALTNEDL